MRCGPMDSISALVRSKPGSSLPSGGFLPWEGEGALCNHQAGLDRGLQTSGAMNNKLLFQQSRCSVLAVLVGFPFLFPYPPRNIVSVFAFAAFTCYLPMASWTSHRTWRWITNDTAY